MSRQDDSPSFRNLFDRYYQAVFSLFIRWGFSRDDAQDLAQVTFLRVFKGMKDYRGDAAWAYVLKIANHVRANELRYRQAQMRGADTTSLDGLPQIPPSSPGTGSGLSTPEEEALAKERSQLHQRRIQQLRDAIEELPPRMRHCIQLRLHRGLKYREVAETMHISIDAVKTLLFQARKRLKQRAGSWSEEQLSLLDEER